MGEQDVLKMQQKKDFPTKFCYCFFRFCWYTALHAVRVSVPLKNNLTKIKKFPIMNIVHIEVSE